MSNRKIEYSDPNTSMLMKLVAWLSLQPRNGTYSYIDTCGCMNAQFFAAEHGVKTVNAGKTAIMFDRQDGHGPVHRKLPPYFDAIAQIEPHTWGAALKRTWRVIERDKDTIHRMSMIEKLQEARYGHQEVVLGPHEELV